MPNSYFYSSNNSHFSNGFLLKASKAALISFSETLRTELGSAIGMTIVTPGLIKTNMSKSKVVN